MNLHAAGDVQETVSTYDHRDQCLAAINQKQDSRWKLRKSSLAVRGSPWLPRVLHVGSDIGRRITFTWKFRFNGMDILLWNWNIRINKFTINTMSAFRVRHRYHPLITIKEMN